MSSLPAETPKPLTFSRRWVWLGALLINLAVVCVAALVLWRAREQYREQAYVMVENLSKVLEQNLIATFEKVDAALLSVIDEIDREKAAGRIDDRALDAYLARIDRRLPKSLGIRISNADGVIVHTVAGVGAGPGQYGDQDYFTHLQGDPRAGLIILGPVLGRLSGKWIVIPARRLTAPDSAYTGAVHAPNPVDYVERMFSSIDVGSPGVVILVSGALNVVARQPDVGRSGSTIGSTALSPELRALITSGRPAARYETRSRLDDVKRTYFYRQIGSYPLYLSVGVADQDFLAAWWREVAQIVGLVVVVGLASLMAAWLIGRRWKDRADAIKRWRGRKNATAPCSVTYRLGSLCAKSSPTTPDVRSTAGFWRSIRRIWMHLRPPFGGDCRPDLEAGFPSRELGLDRLDGYLRRGGAHREVGSFRGLFGEFRAVERGDRLSDGAETGRRSAE